MSKIQEFNLFQTDIMQSILWQYNEATNLVALIQAKQNWYSVFFSGFWGVWEEIAFDLRTVDLFGAAVWSIILDVPLLVSDLPYIPQPTFGFNEYDPSFPTLLNNYVNFENGNFSQYNQNLNLNLEQQRFLLRLRYFQLTTLTNVADINAAIPQSINDFLNYLCTDNEINYPGTIYVIDNFDMTITYHFTSVDFPNALFNVLREFDIFPRPAGVSVSFTGLT